MLRPNDLPIGVLKKEWGLHGIWKKCIFANESIKEAKLINPKL